MSIFLSIFLQGIGDGLLQCHRSSFGPGCCERVLLQSSPGGGDSALMGGSGDQRQRSADCLTERFCNPEELCGQDWSSLRPGNRGQSGQAEGDCHRLPNLAKANQTLLIECPRPPMLALRECD